MDRKILLLAANPKNTDRLRLDRDVHHIQEGLRRAKLGSQFLVKSEWAVHSQDIHQALIDVRPHVVHFSGHDTGAQGLIFENSTGHLKFIPAETLAELFKVCSDSVNCVFLDACYSEIQAQAIVQHIDYVIGIRQRLDDTLTIDFSRGFYGALGTGCSIEEAYEFGCNSIEVDIEAPQSSEELKPILLQRKCLKNKTIVTVNQDDQGLNTASQLNLKITPTDCENIGQPPDNQVTKNALKILVVDDELDNLEMLHRALRRHYRVYRASSGQEALECLKKHGEMAIIISDQRMPKINGTEFLSLTTDTYPDTIRIILSAYTDVEDLVDAINAGKVFKYITKPWKQNDLRQVIDQAAKTYRIVKQRTRDLSQSLRKESLYNSITTKIRSSLDYASTLHSVVEALGQGFEADYAVLYPVDSGRVGKAPNPVVYSNSGESIVDLIEAGAPEAEIVLDKFLRGTQSLTRLAARFTYRNELLASIAIYQIANTWDSNTITLFKSITEEVVMAISLAKLHHRIQRQNDQMRSELEIAKQIQDKLLDQVWTEIPGIKIQAKCQAAQAVGGDFYEVFIHPKGDIWLAVGDVSGKGIPATLLVASVVSFLRQELSASQPLGPETIMANLNQALSVDLVTNAQMITMVLVRYRPTSQELTYSNAGHIDPIVWSQKKLMKGTAGPPQPAYLKASKNVPLGILSQWRTKPDRLSLNKGDVLLLASDSLTKALATTNSQQNKLVETGLWQVLLRQSQGLVLDHLLTQLNSVDNEQYDDQTLLSMELDFERD